jgi:hypothetical protein
LHWVLLPIQRITENTALRYYTPEAQSPFWLLKPASEYSHARLLPRLSWSWTVLLPIDTYKNLLHQLQLFYFYLWPIYWLSLVLKWMLDRMEWYGLDRSGSG